ncbi:MAG: GPR endopeptidase [Oscillospiraceae bacterium]|nr:GPR endopeptidase [Oscillospiraceae bacterium]
MWKKRTDLALEAKELWQEGAREQTRLEGVQAHSSRREGFGVDTVRVLDERGARELDKPVGSYITLTLDGLRRREEDAFGRAARAIAGELKGLLAGVEERGTVLVAGLGNRAITPDAIGPLVHRHTMVTRHLVEQVPEHFGALRPVASLSAGVLGTTGVESGTLIQAVCRAIRPACVIVVDALASRSLHRVCNTVQLADTGIIPGSGVGNHRQAIDRRTLGVPVIAVGVPTVVDGATLAMDLLGQSEPPELAQGVENLMVTPRDIDAQVAELAKVIGFGINLALQDGLSVEDVELFLS